jgi:hypothetical protein
LTFEQLGFFFGSSPGNDFMTRYIYGMTRSMTYFILTFALFNWQYGISDLAEYFNRFS